MAQDLICDGGCGRPAAIIIQIIGTPEVLAFCPPCSGTWAEGHAAEMGRRFPADPPAETDDADSGDLGGGGDTPESPVASDSAADGSELPSGDNLAQGTQEGGNDDGQLRQHDPGLPGGGSRGTGSPGTHDAGQDHGGGRAAGGAGSGKARGGGRRQLDGAGLSSSS